MCGHVCALDGRRETPSLPADVQRLGYALQAAVQLDFHVADALKVEAVVRGLQLPAFRVLVGDAVEAAAGTKAGKAGLLAGGDPGEKPRERPVEAGEGPPGHGHPVLQEVGPGLVQVLELGELVEPGDAHALLPGLPPFFKCRVVGLTLHPEQVLQRPGLASRGLEQVLEGPERRHRANNCREGY